MSDAKKRYCALVVDDNYDIASSFATLLTVMGCHASFVTDPRDALEEARHLLPHIAFLDLAMPHLSGYELAKSLRREFSYEQLKIVAISAHNTPEDRAESRAAGFDAHIAKPADLAMIEAILKTVLP